MVFRGYLNWGSDISATPEQMESCQGVRLVAAASHDSEDTLC